MVAAAEAQMRKLWHTTNIYLYPGIHEYAEKLVSKLPGNLKVRLRITMKKWVQLTRELYKDRQGGRQGVKDLF